MVCNVHQRVIAADPQRVGRVLDTLASGHDQLWPHHRWPPIRFDRPLGVDAEGGHGPVRYTCESYTPRRLVTFRFRRPNGFLGTHGFVVEEAGEDRTRLTHRLEMATRGWARLTWPLIWRPLHDALIEDALDCAEGASTGPGRRDPRPLGAYVRLLRRCATATWSVPASAR